MYLTLLAYFTQSRSLVTLSIVNNRVCIVPVYSKNCYRSQLQARGLTRGSKNKRKKKEGKKMCSSVRLCHYESNTAFKWR
jgi:hypothetical protein